MGDFHRKMCKTVRIGTEKYDQMMLVEKVAILPRGYITFFMLNSTEYDFFPAHKF